MVREIMNYGFLKGVTIESHFYWLSYYKKDPCLQLCIIDLTMQMGHDYIEAYHSYGKDILTSPNHDKLKPRIISLLPNNFRALDIGSANFIFADDVTKDAEAAGKKGEFVVIDPFSTDKRVVNTTAEKYLSEHHEKKFDLIVMEEVIHLLPNLPILFEKFHKILNEDGVIVVFDITKETQLPWTVALQKRFQMATLDQSVFKEVTHLFTIESERECYPKKLQKKELLGLVKYRGWSNLLKNSQEEIDEGLKMIEAQEGDLLPATIGTDLLVFRKIK